MNEAEKIAVLFDHGLDVDTRTLYLVQGSDGNAGEVGPDLAALALLGLGYLDRSEGQINIVINSVGGDEYCMFAIYDAIAACENRVQATVYGSAMSAAALILQAADWRVMAPSATLMAHFGSIGVHTQAGNLPRIAAENARLAVVYRDILTARIRAKKPKIKTETVAHKLMTDWYLGADESVEWGLADEVLT